MLDAKQREQIIKDTLLPLGFDRDQCKKLFSLLETPFEYTLFDSADSKSRDEFASLAIDEIGCVENEDKKAIGDVAKLKKQKVLSPGESKSKFTVWLGDNNAKDGVTDPNDLEFKAFDEANGEDDVCFLLPGNHDVNAHYAATDDAKLLAQIVRTFIDRKTGKLDKAKWKLFHKSEESESEKSESEKSEIDLQDLRKCSNKWNMPGRYGVYHWGKNVDLFAVDSNSFVKDFIAYFSKKDTKTTNQAAWLFRAVRESKAQIKELFLHHPLHTHDKRNIFSDHPDYLSDADLEALEKLGVKTKKSDGTKYNYNEILKQILFIAENKELGIPEGPGSLFTTIHAAHHHSMSMYSSKESKSETPMRQIISGGGGGPLQHRYVFSDHKNVPIAITDRGYVTHEVIPGKNGPTTISTFHTLSGPIVRFNGETLITTPRSEEGEKLRAMVNAARDEFYRFAADPKNSFSQYQPRGGQLARLVGAKDRVYEYLPEFLKNVDQLGVYFNQFNKTDYAADVNYLKEKLEKSVLTKGWWIHLVGVYVDHRYHEKIDELYNKWKEIFARPEWKEIFDRQALSPKVKVEDEKSPLATPSSPRAPKKIDEVGTTDGFLAYLFGYRTAPQKSPSPNPNEARTEVRTELPTQAKTAPINISPKSPVRPSSPSSPKGLFGSPVVVSPMNKFTPPVDTVTPSPVVSPTHG